VRLGKELKESDAQPFWLKTSTNLSVTRRLGKVGAGTALIIGYDFLRSVATSGDGAGARRWRTSGTSSRILLESVYLFASSMTNLVIAIPLEGPRNRGVSSSSPSRIRPPGRTISSVFCGRLSSSVYWAISASRARTLS
jgi:hypothetical protein